MATATKENIDDIAAYDSDEENIELDNKADGEGETTQADSGTGTGIHVSLHSAGFKELFLKSEILRAIGDAGFEHPSEVQHECIPQAILGTDILCQAKSGMGKTAVFVLSVLQQLDAENKNDVTCLVLCHARELAYQIRQEFERMKKYIPTLKTMVIFGGTNLVQCKKDLQTEKPHIVIGTPGRILHLARDKVLNLSSVKHFILDECDKMLETTDMRSDVQQIFKLTPHSKQVMMFSATLPDEIRTVCKRFMHHPHEIYIKDGAKLTLHGLQQYYVLLKEKEKTRKLMDLLDSLEFNQVVIFVRSPERASTLTKLLNKENFPSICTYGKMDQEERIEKYKQFKTFGARIMVATNLLGRGVDFERVNIVINYDMPDEADTYLHRVGRAGRFGTKGLAISFVAEETESDKTVLSAVRSKFVVDLPALPDKIDKTTYMTS